MSHLAGHTINFLTFVFADQDELEQMKEMFLAMPDVPVVVSFRGTLGFVRKQAKYMASMLEGRGIKVENEKMFEENGVQIVCLSVANAAAVKWIDGQLSSIEEFAKGGITESP